MTVPTFITGNHEKAARVNAWLGMDLPHQKVDLEEIQAPVRDIVAYKAKKAYEAIGTAVLVEDVSLECAALGGMPGPYIKWFLDNTGTEAICRMLDGFADRSATARCVWAYYDGTELSYIEGVQEGQIAQSPRGDGGFGWDVLFIPNGQQLTRSEMSPDVYQQHYTESKNFAGVRAFLLARTNQ